MRVKKCLFILLVLFCVLPVGAQPNLHFEHINTKGHCIYCSFRDADGVVWLGTSNGLITFSQLTGNHPFSYSRSEALKEIINQIEQDNIGRLWLRMQSGQYIIYDAYHNKVIEDVSGYLRGMKLPDGLLPKITIDMLGRVWMADNAELAMHDFKTSQTRRYRLPSSAGPIEALKATDNELYLVARNKLYAVSFATWKMRQLSDNPQPMHDFNVFLSVDGLGFVWVATMNALYRFNPTTRQWRHYPEVKLIKAIISLPANRTCVATSNYGLFWFDDDGDMRQMHQAPPNSDGLLSNHIETISFDKLRNTLVIGYNKRGMSLALPYGRDISFNHLSTADNRFQLEDIISLAVAADGKSFWAGTEDHGIFRLSLDNYQEVLERRFESNTVTSLLCDSDGKLWAGLYAKGLSDADGRLLLPDTSPYSLAEPIPGGPIFAAVLGQGIYAIDRHTGKTTHVDTDSPWLMKLSARNGKVYAASDKSIYVIDGRTLKVKSIDTSVFGGSSIMLKGFRDLHADSRGWLWLLSNVNRTPILIYDLKTGKTMRVDDMSRIICHALCEDQQGNMWVSTDDGMVCIRVNTDGKEPQFTTMRIHYSTMRSFFYNDRAISMMPGNRLVLGTSSGTLVLDPDNLMTHTHRELTRLAPIITQIRVNGRYISSVTTKSGKNPISTDVIYAKRIDLKNYENDIMLECRPRGFDSEFEGQYLYSLEGYTDAWTPLDNNTIQLTNMQPGDYELLVKYQPSGGESTKEYSMLHIHISQPFWKSPIGNAIIAFVLSALVLSAFMIVLNRRRIHRRLVEMERQKEQEEKINDMKMRFYTNVSHDLRTPLTLIIGPIEDLMDRFRRQGGDEETLSTLSIVHRNAHRLLGLVNQLLNMRSMETADTTLNLVADDVVQLVTDTVEAFMAQARARSLDLQVKAPFESFYAEFDREKLSRVLNNLLSNSFKFTPDGGTIIVECAIENDGDGNRLHLTVTDTGRGIPEEDRAHIFDLFYTSRRLHIDNKSSGIGLHIVKQYVELMSGTITMTNNDPCGTIAHIEMPLKRAKSAALQSNATALPSSQSSEVSSTLLPPTVRKQAEAASANLLIVEDNPDLLDFMASSLSDTYHIYTATNGEEALALLGDEQPVDVIVSDIMMPVMDGLELTRRIKNDINYSHIPVILLTAKAMEEDELVGLQMGANDYITKPFNIDILRLRISSWMQRRSTARNRFANQADVTPRQLTITTLDQQLFERAVGIVTANMHDPNFNVDQLAVEMGIHRTGLNRKLQFITGQTPILFIRTLRMKRARQLMENDPSQPISQVAYQVGFNNPKIFARYFSEMFGEKPSAFVQRLKEQKGTASAPSDDGNDDGSQPS